MRSLHDPWELGGVEISNRVMLAPLAGIGNWFVRLQAKRYGAGLAVSEMISSFAIHYGNKKTLDELLVVHPDEGPIAIQLFGRLSLEGIDIDLCIGDRRLRRCRRGRRLPMNHAMRWLGTFGRSDLASREQQCTCTEHAENDGVPSADERQIFDDHDRGDLIPMLSNVWFR